MRTTLCGVAARLGICAAGLLVTVAVTAAQQNDYVIGPEDSVSVTVWNQDNLGGTYTVDADGTFAFPLLGRVAAGGLTTRAVEAEMTRLLADGFFKQPQVRVVVQDYRSQRIFVVGAVRIPGTYVLTGGMTLIEALAGAGSSTVAASNEALIVRARTPQTTTQSHILALAGREGSGLPDDAEDVDVIRVDIDALQSGRGAQNVTLRGGDTVFVPPAKTVYVSGEVNQPGEYPIRQVTTVLQALALAGGATEFGATNRIKVIRTVEGEQVELRVKLADAVLEGDTVIVPERFI